jgi:hypothetical protein
MEKEGEDDDEAENERGGGVDQEDPIDDGYYYQFL